jgi:hypothetical protein
MSENSKDANPSRRLVHERKIDLKAYRRDDDLWDIEAELMDTKPQDFQLAAVYRKKNEPIHQMQLKITINEQMEIVQSSAKSLQVPYPSFCENIVPDYSKLVGLKLLKNFREGVKSRLGGYLGCTHLSELTKLLPTVATQGFAGEIFPVQKSTENHSVDGAELPFQFNACHALRTDGEAVKTYHPIWYGYPLQAGKFIFGKNK